MTLGERAGTSWVPGWSAVPGFGQSAWPEQSHGQGGGNSTQPAVEVLLGRVAPLENSPCRGTWQHTEAVSSRKKEWAGQQAHRVARPGRARGLGALADEDSLERVAGTVVEEERLLGAVEVEGVLLEARLGELAVLGAQAVLIWQARTHAVSGRKKERAGNRRAGKRTTAPVVVRDGPADLDLGAREKTVQVASLRPPASKEDAKGAAALTECRRARTAAPWSRGHPS